MDFIFDKFKEECGIFGIYGHHEASTLTQLGLFALTASRTGSVRDCFI